MNTLIKEQGGEQWLKVFVASSGREEVKELVEVFAESLEKFARSKELYLEVAPWFRPDVAKSGEHILNNLKDQWRGTKDTRSSDFFVAFLTNDDLELKKGTRLGTPRDNCVFEMGLFMGGFAFEPKRCVMICSVSEKALPSDLKGYVYLRFKEPRKNSSKREIKKRLKKAVTRVTSRISEHGKFHPREFESITANYLMELERPLGQRAGKLHKSAEVLVNRAEPIEQRDEEFAARVKANLLLGCKYRYFIHNLRRHEHIAGLFHHVATANPDSNGMPSHKRPNKGEVLKTIRLMANSFSINLLRSAGPIEFCIHNSNREDDATCYLRYPNDHKIPAWCEKKDACKLAEELDDLFDKVHPLRVFRIPKSHDPEKYLPVKRAIWEDLQGRFALDKEDEQDLKRVCFGDENI